MAEVKTRQEMKRRKAQSLPPGLRPIVNEEQLRQELTVDKYHLDEETKNQPLLIWKYNNRLGKARSDLDRAEEKVTDVTTKLDEEIRNRPEKFGLDKVTEVAIKRATLRSEEYQRTVKHRQEMRDRLYKLQAACLALDHRRTTLSHLVELQQQNYFAGKT